MMHPDEFDKIMHFIILALVTLCGIFSIRIFKALYYAFQ